MNILEQLMAERAAHSQGLPPPPPVQQRTALERILELSGKTLEELRHESSGEDHAVERVVEVPDSPELRRILNLPRRGLEAGEPMAAAMTAALSRLTPMCQGKKCPLALRPIQALALHDIHQFGGLFGPIRVGAGKTLITYLTPTIMDARRPLLMVPAKLKEKTRREFRHLAYHWLGPHPDAFRIESYEKLGRHQSGNQLDTKGEVVGLGFLETYQPDLIILDEAHKVKNKSAAVTRRFRRYMEEHPNTVVVAVSGTMTTRSLRDYSHICHWCLPKTSPVPHHHKDLEAWADCLDERVNPYRRVRPGAMRLFYSVEERTRAAYGGDSELSAVRQAYRRRLTETPGVVATQDGALGVSLSIQGLDPISVDPTLDNHFRTLRDLWETPDGHPITDGMTMARHARELGMGFYYRWNPRPPDEWMAARKGWAKVCRDIIKYNRRGLDSEAQAVTAVKHGLYPEATPLYELWKALEPTFTPNTEAVWCSPEAILTAERWLKSHNGIVWVYHREFGYELARKTGLPYFAGMGRTEDGRFIEDHPPGVSMIASIDSNSEGRNLQGWCENLIMSCPSNGKVIEQLMGRTHRDGQEAEEVSFWVYLSCLEHAEAFHQASKDATYIQDTQGQAQKVLYADVDFPSLEEVVLERDGHRWRKWWREDA